MLKKKRRKSLKWRKNLLKAIRLISLPDRHCSYLLIVLPLLKPSNPQKAQSAGKVGGMEVNGGAWQSAN